MSIIHEDAQAIAQDEQIPWQQMAGKTVLVTGANGMLGSYIVRALLGRNALGGAPIHIIALCRDAAKAEAVFGSLTQSEHLSLLIQNVSDPITTDGPIHFIIHAASQASPKYYGKDPIGTFLPNVIGTQHLLELAQAKKAESFLFVSTSEVYGASPAEEINESDYGVIDPLNVRSCYAESKRAGETLCVSHYHQYGVPVKIVRPFHCYGPSMRLDDGRVYADFVAAVVQKEAIRLNSDGSARRAFCYLSDAVRAFLLVLLTGEKAAAYNVANAEAELSILQLAERLAALFPERGIKVHSKAAEQQAGYIASKVMRSTPNTQALEALGWRAQIGIDEGFKRTIESFL